MTQEQIEQLLAANEGRIAEENIDQIRDRLANADEGTAEAAFVKLKSPTTAFILSIFTPFDRLYLGDIGMGLLKWFTCGGCWIWWIIDIFSAKKRARKVNAQTVLTMI